MSLAEGHSNPLPRNCNRVMIRRPVLSPVRAARGIGRRANGGGKTEARSSAPARAGSTQRARAGVMAYGVFTVLDQARVSKPFVSLLHLRSFVRNAPGRVMAYSDFTVFRRSETLKPFFSLRDRRGVAQMGVGGAEMRISTPELGACDALSGAMWSSRWQIRQNRADLTRFFVTQNLFQGPARLSCAGRSRTSSVRHSRPRPQHSSG